jgi:hypothetical protein
MVEQQPSKLNTRVRFPSPALISNRKGDRLSLLRNAAVAQLVERLLGKDEVASSNLASSLVVVRRKTGEISSECGSLAIVILPVIRDNYRTRWMWMFICLWWAMSKHPNCYSLP